jgi:hypothetical protein
MPNNYTQRTQPTSTYDDRTPASNTYDDRLGCDYDPTWDEADVMWNNMERSWDSLDSCPVYTDREQPNNSYTKRIIPNNEY